MITENYSKRMLRFVKVIRHLRFVTPLFLMVVFLTNTASATDADDVYQAVKDNLAEMSTFQADLSKSYELWNSTMTSQLETGSSTGSAKLKGSDQASSMIKTTTTSADVDGLTFDFYRDDNMRNFAHFTDARIAYNYETASEDTADWDNADYLGQTTLNSVTVDMIDANFPTSTDIKMKLWVDMTTGVPLKIEYEDVSEGGLGVFARIEVDPNDVTNTGDFYYPVETKITTFGVLDNNDNIVIVEGAFSNITVNDSLSDSEFDFTLPDGDTAENKD